MKHYYLISVEEQDPQVIGGAPYCLEVFEKSESKLPILKIESYEKEMILDTLALYLLRYKFDNVMNCIFDC